MTGNAWVDIIGALIGGGLLKYLADALKWNMQRENSKTPTAKTAAVVATVDQSLAVVARARDELVEENTRLQNRLAFEIARYEADRERWETRERRYRAEIDSLEARLRQLLAEVEQIKHEHDDRKRNFN